MAAQIDAINNKVTDPELLKQLQERVTDPELLKQLEGAPSDKVTDPDLLKQLETQNKPSFLQTLFKQPKELVKGIIEGYGQMGAYGDPETGVGVGGTMGGAIGSKPQEYTPETPFKPPGEDETLSRYVRSAGQNIPGAVTTPGWAAKLLYGPGAGLIGEGASDVAKYFGGDGTYAKMAGAIFGPGFVQRRITPNVIDPRRSVNNKIVDQNLKPYGSSQTAGQATDSAAQMSKELRASPSANLDQTDAFHQRVTAPTGSPTTNITPEWLAETGRGIGNIYDNLERSTHINLGVNPWTRGTKGYVLPELVNLERQRPQDTDAILRTIYDTDKAFSPNQGSKAGEKIHDALFNSIGTNRITGEQYRHLRSNLYSAAESAQTGESAHSFRQVARALDNAMARTNPQWGQAWNANNRRYANFKMAQSAANSNVGKDQFGAKQWIKSGHKVMGPDEFAGSESGRFLDAYGKVMPELKRVEHQPTPLAGLGGGLLGAAGSTLSAALGLPPHWTEPLVGFIAGREAGGDIAKMMAGRTILPQMNPAVQRYKKNQFMPAPPDASGRMIRALINQPKNQDQQPE